MLIRKLCFVCFSLCLFSWLLYGALSYVWYLCFVVLIASCLCVGHAYILMLLYFIEWMFGWSFALLCDHCSHFFMTVLVYDQVAHMFHIIFTWSQFTCYIILVLLLIAIPWGSNVFCASVSSYRYFVPSSLQLLDLGVSEWVLPLFPNTRLSLRSTLECFVMEYPKGEIVKLWFFS